MTRGHSLRALAVRAGAALLAPLAAPGCFTYSSYQSARIVERGDEQATIAFSRSGVAGASDASWYAVEGGGRFGLANRVDGAIMLSVLQNVPEDWGVAVVTVDVRGGIIEDRLACALPVSMTMGDLYLASLRAQPGLIATIPLGERIEIDGGVRAHISLQAMDFFAVGYNVGLGLTGESRRWTLRPEVGWMQFTGEMSGLTYVQYGLGIELNNRKSDAPKEHGS